MRRAFWWFWLGLSILGVLGGAIAWGWYGTRDDIDTMTSDFNWASLGGLIVGLGVSTIWSLVMNRHLERRR